MNEPDVETLFRQQFRRDLRSRALYDGVRPSAAAALVRAANVPTSADLILSDINCPA